jgi:hypothetical protein
MSKPFTSYSPSKTLQATQNSIPTNNFPPPVQEELCRPKEASLHPPPLPYTAPRALPQEQHYCKHLSAHQFKRWIKAKQHLPPEVFLHTGKQYSSLWVWTRGSGLVAQKFRHFASLNA